MDAKPFRAPLCLAPLSTDLLMLFVTQRKLMCILLTGVLFGPAEVLTFDKYKKNDGFR